LSDPIHKKLIKDIINLEKQFVTSKSDSTHQFLSNYFHLLSNASFAQLVEKSISSTFTLKNLDFKKNIKLLENLFTSLKISLDCSIFLKSFALVSHFYISYFTLLNLNKVFENEKGKIQLTFHSDFIINKTIKDLKKLIYWLQIQNDEVLEVNEKSLRKAINAFLVALADDKILIREKKYGKKLHKQTFFSLPFNLNINIMEIDLSFSPFQIKWISDREAIIYSDHYSLIYEILKANPASNKFFRIQKEDRIFKILTQNWVYLDKIMLEKAIKIYADKNKLSLTHTEENIRKLKEFIKDLKHDQTSFNYTSLSSQLSKYLNLNRMLKIWSSNIDNKKIYLPFRFDFRGRFYYLSIISPTFYKEMRYCFHKGEYENEGEKPHALNYITNDIIDNHFYLIENWNKSLIQNKSIAVKRSVIWLLISLGSINKARMGGEVPIIKFIEEGIRILENDMSFPKVEDELKKELIKQIFQEINDNKFIKRLVDKDATASGYQHLIKVLGNQDSKALEYCNFKSMNMWFDTYLKIVETFIKSLKTSQNTILNMFSEDELHYLLQREYTKRTMMTDNYGAGFGTCWQYYLEKLDPNWKQTGKIENVKILFEKFYNYLHESNDILEKSTDFIIDYFIQSKSKFNPDRLVMGFKDSSSVDFSYFISKSKQIETYVNNKRFTKQERFITSKYDMRKLKTSIRANFIQSLDAALARWLIRNGISLAIHDCFMIDYINQSFLISKANEGMRLILHESFIDTNFNTDEIYSPFLII
jgi:hypothetical protein